MLIREVHRLVPMLELVVAVPQFPRALVAPLGRKRHRLAVARSGNFLDLVDMPAQSVEIIKAIVLHPAAAPFSRDDIIGGQNRRIATPRDFAIPDI